MPLAIVTGANAGLGFETSRGLLQRGFEVVITSRDPAKAIQALALLRSEFPRSKVSSLPLDLASSSSIDSFAKLFANQYSGWDVLVNNAGAKILPQHSETDFGVEYHFGVNAVGHFAMTSDLIPFRNPNAKVVSVSSIVARFAPIKLGPAGSAKSYSAAESYAASKLSNLLFALELQDRFGSASFSSVAAHPGFARANPYGPTSTRFFESFLAQSAASGAKPIIEAASNPTVVGGSYLAPKYLELWGNPASGKIPSGCDQSRRRKNWEILEQLSNRKLVF